MTASGANRTLGTLTVSAKCQQRTDWPSRASASLACIRSQTDVATIKSPAHSGTTAFALLPEKSAGTSNLPVCRSYLQPVGRVGADLSAVARRAKAEGVTRHLGDS